jgi:hypothetical protein
LLSFVTDRPTEEQIAMASKDVNQKQDFGLSLGPIIDSFVKLSSSCDKFLNCQYVSKQLEDEHKQEEKGQSAVERVWSKMDHSLEVELYRQFLFEQNSPMPSFEDAADDVSLQHRAQQSSSLPSTPHRMERQRS